MHAIKNLTANKLRSINILCSHAGKVLKFTYPLAVDKQKLSNNWNQFENNLYPQDSWPWSQLAADKHNKQEILWAFEHWGCRCERCLSTAMIDNVATDTRHQLIHSLTTTTEYFCKLDKLLNLYKIFCSFCVSRFRFLLKINLVPNDHF